MPISSSEIKYYKSAHLGLSLGGAITTNEITTAELNNLWDDVASSEAASLTGYTEYRCLYIQNKNATIDLLKALFYLNTNTPHTDTTIEIALGSTGVDAAETVELVDEVDSSGLLAAAGVTFYSGEGIENGLDIGTIPANGGFMAVWLKRIVAASADPYPLDNVVIGVIGETTT